MKILYSPQRSEDQIVYTFLYETIVASYQVKAEQMVDGQTQYVWQETESDVFEFSLFEDGLLEDIETDLPVNPILSAKREDGELYITLLNYIGVDATDIERYPEWMEV